MDGGKTLTTAVTGTIYRWDTATGKSLIPEGAETAVAQILVTPDGSRVITCGQYGRFLRTPADAVKFFAERIKPVKTLDPKRVERLLADLDSNEFAVREAASKALAGLDEQATPYFEEMLKSTDAAEVRVRVTRILEQGRGAAITADQIRQIRAVMVLERIGDGEA